MSEREGDVRWPNACFRPVSFGRSALSCVRGGVVVRGESLPLHEHSAGRIEIGDDASHRRHGEPGGRLGERDRHLVLDRRGEEPCRGEHDGSADLQAIVTG